MTTRDIQFPNSAWTILRRDETSSGVYLWQQPDFSAVFLLSSKQLAEQVLQDLKLNNYMAYQFPDRETLLKLLESMAAAGVSSVASDPGKIGPMVSPIQEVIIQLRSMA